MSSAVAGYYTDPHEFLEGCKAARDKGYKGLDAYCPYPAHGFEEALGMKRSWIGRPVFFMLLFGAFLGFMMQVYMMKMDWPINLGGKPYNSWPQFVVITFEAGILLGALTNMAMAFLTGNLGPKPNTWNFRDDLTDDTFAVIVPLEGNGDADEIKKVLADAGAENPEIIDEDSGGAKATEPESEAAGEVEHA